MNSRDREILERIYDDEFKSLDDDLNSGVITQEKYNEYLKNLNIQYKEDLAELK